MFLQQVRFRRNGQCGQRGGLEAGRERSFVPFARDRASVEDVLVAT